MDEQACADADQVCRAGGNVCVECNVDADCTDPSAARCDAGTNSCVPCNDDDQCSGITGTEACAEGTCVECTATNRAACGDDICASRDDVDLGAVRNRCVAGVEPEDALLCG
ncbi:MAG: hypothetical protein MO852_17005, partial [Candidatus Devosia euplotis]|nr:hypothetical protein [Candidatus Devosia euplotis]